MTKKNTGPDSKNKYGKKLPSSPLEEAKYTDAVAVAPVTKSNMSEPQCQNERGNCSQNLGNTGGYPQFGHVDRDGAHRFTGSAIDSNVVEQFLAAGLLFVVTVEPNR